MEDRKSRFNEKNEVQGKLAEALRKLAGSATLFDGVHIFTPHADVADDGMLRLVFLNPEKYYTKQDTRFAFDEVLDFIRNNGSKPRYRGNRLVFIAPDYATMSRIRECVRTVLAWNSIVDDVNDGRLNIDRLQEQQAKKELQTAEEVLPRAARECYKWLLCPVMATPTDRQPTIEAFPLNTSGSAFGAEVERVCQENELIITAWSPIHLRTKLQELYWKPEKVATGALSFWEDMQRYLYLPRLRNRGVLEQTVVKGASSKDFFGTAYAQKVDAFEGFKFGDSDVQFDGTLLLIEPEAAKRYEASIVKPAPGGVCGGVETPWPTSGALPAGSGAKTGVAGNAPTSGVTKAHAFYGSVDINASTAKTRLVDLAEEVISILTKDPQSTVKIVVEITAEFPSGVSDQVKRAVSENATNLGFKNKTWE